MLELLLTCLALINTVAPIAIDNGVVGSPVVLCTPTHIGITATTKAPFEGKAAVRGSYLTPGCSTNSSSGRTVTLLIPFNMCNVQRRRSLNPRGVYVEAGFGIQFHPHFVTKVDRLYAIQCFYMEAEKAVTQQLQISVLTTVNLFGTPGPMPVCSYDILTGGPSGQSLRYALVGQPVYHKWTCVSETPDMYCMRVHSCFAHDGGGNSVDFMNEDGCSLDKFILPDLEYLNDLTAGQETHVFKYADRTSLFFQCQVAVTLKEPSQSCVKPTCSSPLISATTRAPTVNMETDDSSTIMGASIFVQSNTPRGTNNTPASPGFSVTGPSPQVGGETVSGASLQTPSTTFGPAPPSIPGFPTPDPFVPGSSNATGINFPGYQALGIINVGQAIRSGRPIFERNLPKRDIVENVEIGTIDVTAHMLSFDAEEITENSTESQFILQRKVERGKTGDRYCITGVVFGLMTSLIVVLFIAAVVPTGILCFCSWKSRVC